MKEVFLNAMIFASWACLITGYFELLMAATGKADTDQLVFFICAAVYRTNYVILSKEGN